MDLKNMFENQNLTTAHTICLPMNSNTKPNPHPNSLIQLDPLIKSLHYCWLGPSQLLGCNLNLEWPLPSVNPHAQLGQRMDLGYITAENYSGYNLEWSHAVLQDWDSCRVDYCGKALSPNTYKLDCDLTQTQCLTHILTLAFHPALQGEHCSTER